MNLMQMSKRNKKNTSIFQNAVENEGQIVYRVSDQEIKKQMTRIGINLQDLSVMNCLQPIVKGHISEIIYNFYSAIEEDRQLAETVTVHTSVESLKQTLKNQITEIFSGKVNDEYINKRKQNAKMLFKVGFESKWFINALNNLQIDLLAIFDEKIMSKEDYVTATKATSKFFGLEQHIVLDVYEQENAEYRTITETSKVETRARVSGTAIQLAAIAEETSASIEEINAQTREIASYAIDRSEIAAEAEKEAHQGKQDLDEQQALMEKVRSSTGDITNKMTVLEETSDQVKKIVTIVTDIAEQTNMLALNAAIESARAGEFGKGFAVVANEVRNLAEETKRSVSDVSNLILKINQQVGQISGSVQDVADLSIKGSDSMKKITASFDIILATMEKNKMQSNNTKVELDNISQVIDEVTHAINDIAVSTEGLKALSEKI